MPDKIDISTPKGWNDLTREQLLFVCKQYEKEQGKVSFITMAAMKIYGLKLIRMHIIENKKVFEFKHKGKRVMITASTFNGLKEKLNFLLSESDLHMNRLPYLRVGRLRMRKYWGPDHKMFNVILDEFLSAENHFIAYNATRDPRHLDMLVACLYRPQVKRYRPHNVNYSGDRRQSFNANLVGYHAGMIRRVPMKYKIAIYQYFSGCMEFLRSMFEKAFTSSGDSGDSRSRLFNVLMMENYLKNGDVSKEEVLRVNIHKVFAHIHAEADKIEKLKKQ